MNKKGFTLIEVMVSITIFSIVIVFLYQSLNLSKTFNETFTKHLNNYISIYDLEKIIFEDILETKGEISIKTDKNDNTIFQITQSNNTYHDPFNKYITYLLSNNNKLIRIESKEKFDITKSKNAFLEKQNTYIDIVAKDIEKFKILNNIKNSKAFTIYIKTVQGKDYLFSVKTIIP